MRKNSKIRRPTPYNKLRVVVVGDSLAAGLGVYLEREFRPALVRVLRQGRISTGLSRLDYFDWIGEMRKIEKSYQPDLVVVMVGDNDNQSLQSPDGKIVAEIGSFEWPGGYEARVEEFTRIAVDGGAHVTWVGLPIVQRKERWDVMQRQNDIFERVVDPVPNAIYVDTWDRFATRDGQYTPFYWEGGQAELVRATDGFHFTPRGYELRGGGGRRRGRRGVPAPDRRGQRVARARSDLDRHLGKVGERGVLVGSVELEVGQRAREVVVVGLHVEVPVAAEVEQDHALLTRLARRDRLVDRALDRVVGLGGRQDALRLARTAARPRRSRSGCTPRRPCARA